MQYKGYDTIVGDESNRIHATHQGSQVVHRAQLSTAQDAGRLWLVDEKPPVFLRERVYEPCVRVDLDDWYVRVKQRIRFLREEPNVPFAVVIHAAGAYQVKDPSIQAVKLRVQGEKLFIQLYSPFR
jgi:hypothetical protein